MARQLRPDEAQVFGEGFPASFPTDAETLLRSLLEKQDEPLDLTLAPGVWIKGTPPETLGS